MSVFPDVFGLTLSGNGPVRNLCRVSDRGSLRFEDRDVLNQTCKFTTEIAETDALLGFHIRCLFNNKYLVRDASSNWLVAAKSEKEEDTSKQDCTLFQRQPVSDPAIIKLTHVQTNRTVSIARPEDPVNAYYVCVEPSGAIHAESIIVNINDLVVLPRHVLLKEASTEGKYLISKSNEEYPNFTGEDRYSRDAWYETSRTSNGDYIFKSVRKQKFLRSRNGWIVSDLDNANGDNRESHFKVLLLDNESVTALQSRGGNNQFCRRMTAEGKTNCLAPTTDDAIVEAHLQVDEPVINRQVKLEYRLQHSRVYDETPKSWASSVAYNDTSEENNFTLRVRYTETYSHTKHRSRSISTSVGTSFSVKVPFVAKKEISVEAGVEFTSGWEETNGKEEYHEAEVSVFIPQRQKRQAKMVAFQGKCDVPFTYVQRDTLANGNIIETSLEDGLITAMNGYHFVIEIFDPDRPEVIIETRGYTPIDLPEFVQEGVEEEYARKGIKLVKRTN